MMKQILSLLFLSAMVSSCAMFEHRDYYDEMVFSDLEGPLIIPGDDFEVVAGDTGRAHRSRHEILQRTPATIGDKRRFDHSSSLQEELFSLENKISDAEYHVYLKYQDEFNSDSEKIYFLRLPPAQKKDYLQAKGLIDNGKTKVHSRGLAGFYSQPFETTNTAIQLGMDQQRVLDVWGRPMRRDIAGSPEDQNERWAYQVGEKVKYVYFEKGVVEGWSEQ